MNVKQKLGTRCFVQIGEMNDDGSSDEYGNNKDHEEGAIQRHSENADMKLEDLAVANALKEEDEAS